MKKLITTLALLAGLILGSLAIAPAAQADGHGIRCGGITGTPCPPEPEPCGGLTGVPCPEPEPACGLNPCGGLASAEQTANDYRAQVIALTADLAASKAEAARLKARSDRQAVTIQRLRAKIRSLR